LVPGRGIRAGHGHAAGAVSGLKEEHVQTDRRSPAGRRISRATITEQLEEALRIDILTGTLTPGTRIRANVLAERYGVSATPLREALQRLAGENLIELDPRLGASVARMSEAELRDIYATLSWLGGLAVERSIANGDAVWEERLQRSWESLAAAVDRSEALGEDPPDRVRRETALAWSRAHWAFHEALYSACASSWLLRFLRQLHSHADRYQMPTMHGPVAHRRDSKGEHEHILRAALARDTETAAAALREHFGITVQILLKDSGLLFDDRSSPSDGD
jgi:GntR family carbon starvation induced transcriptional regulator